MYNRNCCTVITCSSVSVCVIVVVMLCSLNVFFLQKFQKIVEAYVRYRIDPDDCDQMKMKEILLEVYSFHDAIASGQY